MRNVSTSFSNFIQLIPKCMSEKTFSESERHISKVVLRQLKDIQDFEGSTSMTMNLDLSTASMLLGSTKRLIPPITKWQLKNQIWVKFRSIRKRLLGLQDQEALHL